MRHCETKAEMGVLCAQTREHCGLWLPPEGGREAPIRFSLRATGKNQSCSCLDFEILGPKNVSELISVVFSYRVYDNLLHQSQVSNLHSMNKYPNICYNFFSKMLYINLTISLHRKLHEHGLLCF